MKSAPFWSISGTADVRPGFLGIEASWDGAARALFLAVTILVVITFTDYGITWDEDVHNYYGILVLNYYLSGFTDLRATHWQDLFNYGGAFDMIAAILNHVSPFDTYETRHLLNGLVGVLGLVGVWRLGRALAGPRAGFLAALFLDPFFYLAQGRNDILFLAPIVLGVLAWERDRPMLAALAFGAAAAFKPFAVFLLPLLALLVWRRSRAERWSTARQLSVLAGLILPGLLTIAPFFLWNPGAYWADTVSFVSGSDPHRYPIQGYGFSEILLLLKIIPSPGAYFPFAILQALGTLPVFALGIRRVVGRPTLATVLWWATATLAVVLFFSRFVNDNYLAVVLFLAILAGATRRGARRIGQHVDRDVFTRPAAAA